MDFKLELVQVPVSDVDRAKAFYTEKAGFIADHDHAVSEEIRFVQLTPPGSACSIALGKGIVDAPPGSVQGLQLVVPDIEAARAELVERGVEVSLGLLEALGLALAGLLQRTALLCPSGFQVFSLFHVALFRRYPVSRRPSRSRPRRARSCRP